MTPSLDPWAALPIALSDLLSRMPPPRGTIYGVDTRYFCWRDPEGIWWRVRAGLTEDLTC